MRVTTDHPLSSHGVPVILDDAGAVLGTVPGLTAALERLGLSRREFAEACGVSTRTVEGWFAGRPIHGAAPLNVLGDLLRSRARSRAKQPRRPAAG